MSPVHGSTAQPPLTLQLTANPQSQHKRKRVEVGDSEPTTRNESKRSKVRLSSTEKSKGSHAQTAEIVTIVPKVKRGKDDEHAIRSKAAKPVAVSETKLAKRERRKSKREQDLLPHNREIEGARQDGQSLTSGQDAGSQRPTDSRPSAKKAKHKENGARPDLSSSWTLSEPVGGRFIESEPLFSADEKYLILAKESHVEVYSSSTSSLVRSLAMGYRSPISASSLSQVNPHILYVSTFAGTIYRFDWTEGKRLARWDVSSQITGLATAASPDADEDIVYTIDRSERRGNWMLTAHKLMAGNKASSSELSTLCRSQEPITGLKGLEGGRYLVVTFGKRLMIGQRNESYQAAFATTTYTWREITVPERITCFDARLPDHPAPQQSTGLKPKSLGVASKSAVDIVVGNAKGEIYIYQNLLDQLIRRERSDRAGKAASLAGSLQHWHREAVSTVKWSLDGNYVISGGVETVLVLWQLETGARQYLPHLSSAIENLVVSPTGSAYALRLADNSVMVLSTTELKPTASIAGIQCFGNGSTNIAQQYSATASSSAVNRLTDPSKEQLKAPAAVSPLNPNQLLLAVAASRPTNSAPVPTNRAAFLQTFDLATAQHISRQALARNNTTVVNIGGSGDKIREPVIRYMQVSHDGQWLATVDEWCDPLEDMDHLMMSGSVHEPGSRLDVFLKFWSWNAEATEWQLVTRVDAPHGSASRDGHGAGRVLAFIPDPSVLGFVSLGEDGVVCVWRPRSRRRDGLQVRDRNANGLITWSCHKVTQLLHLTQSNDLLNASIAFAEDGSLLAASLQNSCADVGVVNFIDPLSGEIKSTRPGLYAGQLVDMGIIDRYLIILSDHLIVWDMVDDELHFGLSLRPAGSSSHRRAAARHLAVDQRHRTFAIALPVLGNGKGNPAPKAQFQMAVFDPSLATPLYTTLLPHLVTSLLPSKGSEGYVVLDSAAEARTLSPKASQFTSNLMVDAGTIIPPVTGLNGIYGHDWSTNIHLARDGIESRRKRTSVTTPPSTFAETRPQLYNNYDDAPVVSQQQLTDIFDNGPVFAMPPVKKLFEQVASLFTRKPRMT